MSKKINLEDLKLVEVVSTNIASVNGVEIEIKSYLPIQGKMELIEMSIQESLDPITGLIDKVKMDGIFNALIAIMYAGIQIDSTKLLESYDTLEHNGVMDVIVSTIPENEYNSLTSYLEEAIEDYDRYRTSVPGMIAQFVNRLPEASKEINEALEAFDISKFTNAMGFAQAIGGNESAFANAILGQK